MNKVIPISPEHAADNHGEFRRVDLIRQLEKLEDSFLAGLQDLRSIKAELRKQADSATGLEKLLDAKKVAELLGESERWVYKQAKSKEIPSIRIGKYWKFSPSALQKWIEQRAKAVDS